MTPPPAENPSSSQKTPAKRSANDYIFGKEIGEGSFSTVYLAKDIHNKKELAIKVCEKRHIIREKKAEYIQREKEVLNILSNCNKFFVRLYCTFQDPERLYFVLTYAKNGEMLQFINKVGSFDLTCTRFYTAELILALEALRSKGIIHRDLKPENILLDEKMHILITDFGSAKIVERELPKNENGVDDNTDRKRKNSFVGTAQYVSPELLTDQGATYSSDLWALGCVVYQMMAGVPPFTALNEYQIFQKILKLDYEIPDAFDSKVKDFTQKLLIIEPEKRLGAVDETPYTSLRNHRLFTNVDFNNLGDPPQICPYLLQGDSSVRNSFEIPITKEPGLDNEKVSRLQFEGLCPESKSAKNMANINPLEIQRRLETQMQTLSEWHALVEGNLILKQGPVDKRKGLFARRRMLLLTLGPHLYYVDPNPMILKGEIPWTSDLKVEPKNFKTFFVHTPNRTYYLEDPEGYALTWCKAIEEVHSHYFTQPIP